jgi:hypothetical protein
MAAAKLKDVKQADLAAKAVIASTQTIIPDFK